MSARRLAGTALAVATCGGIVVAAGGGISFLLRPVGAAYLILSLLWWLLAALRQRGESSAYHRRQRAAAIAMSVVGVPLLLVGPPWEYSRFAGPIPRDGLLAWGGLGLFASGIFLQAAAMRALGNLFTLRLGIRTGHRLVTSGPYRLVRHPAYLSYLLSIAGIGLSMGSLIALGTGVLTVPFLLWRIGQEEEMLLAGFGDEYRGYMHRTKRLIPLVY